MFIDTMVFLREGQGQSLAWTVVESCAQSTGSKPMSTLENATTYGSVCQLLKTDRVRQRARAESENEREKERERASERERESEKERDRARERARERESERVRERERARTHWTTLPEEPAVFSVDQ